MNRDDGCNFVVASNGFFNSPLDPTVVETLTCKEAVSWLKGRGYSPINMETYCLFLTKALSQPYADLSPLGPIINYCTKILNNVHSIPIFSRFILRTKCLIIDYESYYSIYFNFYIIYFYIYKITPNINNKLNPSIKP